MAKKRQSPMVIFWPEDGTLWTWNTSPLHPRLKEAFSRILGKVGNKGHSTVTIIRVDRPRRKLLRGRRLEAQCTAFDFHIGGLEKAGAREIAASINTRSAGPSDTETSRSPELSLQVYKEHKRVYFRMELPNFGRR